MRPDHDRSRNWYWNQYLRKTLISASTNNTSSALIYGYRSQYWYDKGFVVAGGHQHRDFKKGRYWYLR